MSEELQSQVPALRFANRINEASFEKIWRYYYDTTAKVELTEKHEEIRSRMVNLWDLIVGKILNDRRAIKAHLKWCEDKGYKISERTAYEDLKYCKRLFGDRKNSTKEREKSIIAEILFNAISYAWKEKDLKSLEKLVKRYNAVRGLEETGGSDVAWTPIVINLKADPETLKKQMEDLRRRAEAANSTEVSPEP